MRMFIKRILFQIVFVFVFLVSIYSPSVGKEWSLVNQYVYRVDLPLVESPSIVQVNKQVIAIAGVWPYFTMLQGELTVNPPIGQVIVSPVLQLDTFYSDGTPYKTVTATTWFTTVLPASNYFQIVFPDAAPDCYPYPHVGCYSFSQDPYTLSVKSYELKPAGLYVSPRVSVVPNTLEQSATEMTTTVKNESLTHSIKNVRVITVWGFRQSVPPVIDDILLLKPQEEVHFYHALSGRYVFPDPDYPPVAYAVGEIVK